VGKLADYTAQRPSEVSPAFALRRGG